MSRTLPQNSALYQNDRLLVDRLLSHQGEPSPSQITDAARLLSRYQDTTHLDLVTDIAKAISHWGSTPADNNQKAKAIWESGWRPGGYSAAVTVGSGADQDDS